MTERQEREIDEQAEREAIALSRHRRSLLKLAGVQVHREYWGTVTSRREECEDA